MEYLITAHYCNSNVVQRVGLQDEPLRSNQKPTMSFDGETYYLQATPISNRQKKTQWYARLKAK